MLRKGLVALMMGVICAGSAIAEQPAQKRSTPAPTGLVGWLKGKTASSKSEKTSSKATASKPAASKPATKASQPMVAASKATGSNATASKPVVQRPSAGNAAASKSKTQKPGFFASLTGSKKTNATASAPAKPKAKPAAPAAGIERAVVADAERQAVQIRQTAAQPQDSAPAEMAFAPAESALQPVPIQQAPVLPNVQTVSGPQYFSATSSSMSNPIPVHPGSNWQSYQAPQPVHVNSQGQYWNASHSPAPAGPAYNGYAQMSPQNGMYPQNGGGMYPQTGAALYPAPRPGIPHQVGGIAIENQAFHPHEMLYAHKYKAMYPPYYYKVNGGWMVTPFGVWSHEDWKLQGTTVDVKYKSHISPFTLFKPPVIR